MEREEEWYTDGFCYAPCPLCASTKSDELFHSKDYNWGIPGIFRYVKCADCSLVYENPRPVAERIMDLYPRFYGTTLRDGSADLESKLDISIHHFRAAAIEAFTSSGSIFDIGCGSGFFLEYMRRRGWNISGIDPSAEHVEYAQEYLGLQEVQKGIWPLVNMKGFRADVVTMFHVIEHLTDPVDALFRTKELLVKDGVLVVETPNVGSWPMWIFGRYCTQLDAPRHICLFSKSTLKQCVEKAGFVVEKLNTFSPTGMEYTESMRYLIQDLGIRRYRDKGAPSQSSQVVERNIPNAPSGSSTSCKELLLRLFHTGERLCVRACNFFAQMTSNGCSLFMIARKK